MEASNEQRRICVGDVLEGGSDAYGGDFVGKPGLCRRGRRRLGGKGEGAADLVVDWMDGGLLVPSWWRGLLRWLLLRVLLFLGFCGYVVRVSMEVLKRFVDETACCLGPGGIGRGVRGWIAELEVVERHLCCRGIQEITKAR